MFLPTASPTAAFWGGERPGDDLFSSAVVALDGTTGQVTWRFQTTHHDVWDYDVAAQPTLATVRRDGRDVPVTVVATKMGFLFVLDRTTGQPVFPVTEQPVPASDVPGEVVSPTQPIPSAPPPLVPQMLRPEDAFGVAVIDRLGCRRRIEHLRSDGLYHAAQSARVGDLSVHRWRRELGRRRLRPRERSVLHQHDEPGACRAAELPRADLDAARQAAPKAEIGRGIGTPYAAERTLLTSFLGVPCNKPPWGTLAAVDLSVGTIRWQVPLGRMALGMVRGLPNLGGARS